MSRKQWGHGFHAGLSAREVLPAALSDLISFYFIEYENEKFARCGTVISKLEEGFYIVFQSNNRDSGQNTYGYKIRHLQDMAQLSLFRDQSLWERELKRLSLTEEETEE